MSDLLEFGFIIEGNGLRVWAHPGEPFHISYFQWVRTGENMKTLTEIFWYVFEAVAGQDTPVCLRISKMEKAGLKTVTAVFVEAVTFDSVARTSNTKVPILVKLLAEREGAEGSLQRAREGRVDYDCDDAQVDNGFIRCCLGHDGQGKGLVVWDDSIIPGNFSSC